MQSRLEKEMNKWKDKDLLLLKKYKEVDSLINEYRKSEEFKSFKGDVDEEREFLIETENKLSNQKDMLSRSVDLLEGLLEDKSSKLATLDPESDAYKNLQKTLAELKLNLEETKAEEDKITSEIKKLNLSILKEYWDIINNKIDEKYLEFGLTKDELKEGIALLDKEKKLTRRLERLWKMGMESLLGKWTEYADAHFEIIPEDEVSQDAE